MSKAIDTRKTRARFMVCPLLRLAGPIALSMALGTFTGVIDTLMVAPLGTVPLAAVAITTAILITFYSGIYGFVSASSVRFAQSLGHSAPQALADRTCVALLIATVTGLLSFALMAALLPTLEYLGQPPEVLKILPDYWYFISALLIPFTLLATFKALFEAIGKPWLGTGLALLDLSLNTVFNYVFIYALEMGLMGAGIASLLSHTLVCLLALGIWAFAPFTQKTRGKLPCKNRFTLEAKVQFREGSTIGFGYISEGGAYMAIGLMMGGFGAVALAAHQIVNAIGTVLYMVPLGVSTAVSILTGKAAGANRSYRFSPIAKAALGVIGAWMCLVITSLLTLRGEITEQLASEAEVAVLTIQLFGIVAFMQIADGVQGTMLGAARGIMDNRIPVLITLICNWLICLPLAYTIGYIAGLGPLGLWYGYSFGLAIAALLLLHRFFKKAQLNG